MQAKPTCTCTDTNCPFNPVNHDKGCDLCIAKCQRQGEIPGCFFQAVSGHMDTDGDYTYRGFANYVEKHEGDAPA